KGCYKTYNAFIEVCSGIIEIEDQHHRGKGLQNLKYDTAWDMVCINTALMAPRVYCSVSTITSWPVTRYGTGRFQVGIVDINFDTYSNAAAWLKKMGYAGLPTTLAVDDTALKPALRTYKDGSRWMVAGLHGVPAEIHSYDELLDMSTVDRSQLAVKV
ncbi:hypothetical protein BDZ89DRAFT_967025, partial [Hymenopellis radicata]